MQLLKLLQLDILPTTVNSPLGLKLVSYPNGAIIPTEGADILAVRANLQTDHDGIVSSACACACVE